MIDWTAVVVIAGMISIGACGGSKAAVDAGAGHAGSGGRGGGGGNAGSAGNAGAAGNVGGSGNSGNAGHAAGGAAGTGGAPLTSCPAERPFNSPACAGTLLCNYNDMCRCNVCCYSTYVCMAGRFMFGGNNDGCLQMNVCPDSGADAVDARADAGDATTAAVCTFGMDGTCNDNPIWAGIYGRCTDAGACVCGDAGANPASGRCLMPAP